ncbi:MAG TPA: ATP-binding protein [Anaerolineales bacterium]
MIRRFLNRISAQSIDRSLRAKITLGIVLPMVLLLAIFLFIEYTLHRTALLNNLSMLASYNGQVIEESVQSSMLVSDFSGVQKTLDLVGSNKIYRVVYILDPSGRVIYAPKGAGLGIQLNNQNPTCQPCHHLPVAARPSGVVVAEVDGQRVFRSMHPIANAPACTQCHNPSQKLLGLLLTDISVAPFEAAMVADLRDNIILGGSVILISAVIANLVMSRLVIRRLKRVSDALAGFGGGERGLRLALDSADEVGRLEVDFNEMSQRIQVEESQNRTLSENLVRQTIHQEELLKRLVTAQEDERKRIARELHDELGQSLGGLALHSEVMGKYIQTDPQRALEQLSLTQELIGKTTQQMYDLILALRPSALDDLGLSAALHSLGERLFNGSGILFTLDSSALGQRLPPSVETALYRVFQEALSNVLRHSGAGQVKVTLARSDGFFEGEVVDNGCGFDYENLPQPAEDPRGLGLMGMQERVAQCGGSLEINSRSGGGTCIHVRIPLTGENCK